MSQAPMTELTGDDKLWAALSYFPLAIWPFISIIVLLMEDKKSRPYIKFNAIQSLIVGVVAIVTSPLCGLGLLVIVYMFYLTYLAYQGQEVKVPFVTDFIKNQGWA